MGDNEQFFIWILFSAILLSTFFVFNLLIYSKKYRNLPPGPWSLPVIGHLHLLKPPIHRCLHELSMKYGHVLFLRFGSRNVVVVSSPEAVEECFTKKNDIIFANRPKLLVGKLLNYDNKTIGLASYGHHWRILRRLAAVELLSSNRLSSFTKVRQEEVRLLLKQLYYEKEEIIKSSGFLSDLEVANKAVELRPFLTDLSFNIIMRMIAGKRYHGKDAVMDEEAKEFRDIVSQVFELSGISNLADALPVFEMVDIQGLKKRMKILMKKLDNFLQKLIDDRRKIKNREEAAESTFIDVILSLAETEAEYNSDETVKALILTLVTAGTESSVTTLEWAMTLLLNNPEAKAKTLAEIQRIVEDRQRLMDESDLPKLNYLQGVINETFRLYPTAPLLAPHESSEDCKICGFDIPKGTMLLVNTWTIQRDPKVWEDPTRFKPERHDGDDGELGEGYCYKLIPFGVGRRACPGANLGRKVVALALGSLIQCFDWEKEDGDKEIDMREGMGITMPKMEPLKAIYKPRQNMVDLLVRL